MGPVVNEYGDGDDQVEDQKRSDEEVERRIEAGVVFVVLRCGMVPRFE